MIQLEKNAITIPRKTINKLEGKEIKIYLFLLGEQQNRIFYQNVKEIAKAIKWGYNTTNKYMMSLKNKKLISKSNGLYYVNYF